MFSLFSGIYDFTKKPKREKKILVLGLDGSGKSTLINSLKICATTLGHEGNVGGELEANTVSPTLGLNLVKIELPSLNIELMEIGGKESFRSMWSHYYEDADKILFIVDASSSDRFEDARTAFVKVIEQPDLKDKAILLVANKMDKEEARLNDAISTIGDFTSSFARIQVYPCSSFNKDEIKGLFTWLEM